MDTTVRDPLVGRVLDERYEVGSRIARGGMATIYAALDRRLDRRIALKVMHPHLADDSEFVERFIREARSAARLSHPNVVQVFDQGSDGDVLYLAMELLPGRTLREVITERGVLTPREALTVAEPVLDALAAAHRAGLVHRDVKPENVILTDDGRVKVADFGLARAISGGATQTAVLIGTVAYLAPELVARGRADARSDVYAAGIVLFEMLTGRQPFTGEVPMQVAYRHVHEEVPKPSSLVPTLPSELDDLVTAAAARDPDNRPVDAGAWLTALRKVRTALAEDVLDARPMAPAVAPSGSGEQPFGSPTELVAPVVRPNPTQTLPQLSGLRRLRERSRREADENDGYPVAGFDVLDEAGENVDEADADLHDRDGPDGSNGPDGGRRARSEVGVDQATFSAGRQRNGRGAAPADASEPAAVVEAAELRQLARARRRRGLLGLLVVMGVTLSLALGSWYLVAGPGAFTVTPSLTNLTEVEARSVLQQDGLEIRVEQGDYSDTVEKGRILRTRPSAGNRIRKNGAVSVYLSQGTAVRGVPKLVGLDREQAERALEKAGLQLGAVSEKYSDTVDEGRVIGTAPGAGKELKLGSAVNVVFSRGPEPVQLPDVRGWWLDDARQALAEIGLVVEVTEAVNQDFEAGRVLEQDRQPGETVLRTSTVKLVVAQQEQLVQVPDVVGQDADAARAELERRGFQVDSRGGGPSNKVRDQKPNAGEEAATGSTVTILVF